MERRARRGQARLAAFAASLLLVLGLLNEWDPDAAALPEVAEPCVLVLAAPLPQPLTAFSDHCYFVVKDAGEWERWEVWQGIHPGKERPNWGHVHRDLFTPLHGVGGGPPRLLAELRSERAAAFIAHLRDRSPLYAHRQRYLAYPGPNSNTFVEAMLRSGGLGITLPPTAVGKDYRGVIGANQTASGFQLETPLLGMKLGLREGIEVHPLSLTVGLDFYPPALLVPFGDGRLGRPDQ